MAALPTFVAGALAAAGGAGAARYVSTFWPYHDFRPLSMPRTVAVPGPARVRRVPVVAPTVRVITVTSRALGGYPDRVYVVLPPGYGSHPAQRYPVLYLLHGFPGYPSQFLRFGEVGATEAALVAAGLMKPMILVMPTGTRSFHSDVEWANGVRRGSGWETFVARDLVKTVDARYRTIPSGRSRGIAGLSEGGYGALNIGLHHPGEFSLLESWSGYMIADRMPSVFGRGACRLDYNSPALWLRSALPRVRAHHLYLWFYVGRTDPLAPQNRAFNAELAALGVPHLFFESPGPHNWKLWRGLMPQAFLTASDHLSHG